LSSAAQKKETFYDFYWKPCAATEARFYSIVQKTDSGWLRKDYYISNKSLQMQALFEDEACKIANGHMYYFHVNGNPSIIGRKLHGKNDGVCVSYHFNGYIWDSAEYKNGRVTGIRYRWYDNGSMSDSISHVNDSMDVQVSWFENGEIESGGYRLHNKLHGKWQFFHRNGKLAAFIVYNKGKAISKEYFKEDGAALSDTSQVNKEASFARGGLAGWKKYLERNLQWPSNLKFTNGYMATVGVTFSINEEGKVDDIRVTTPFHSDFDKAAERIIRQSPAWTPAMHENRKVKSWHTQPVSFVQQEE
jgi:TonB family protein